jgi:hypothetical protein
LNVPDAKVFCEKKNVAAEQSGYQAAKNALLIVSKNEGFNFSYNETAQKIAGETFPHAYSTSYMEAFTTYAAELDNGTQLTTISVDIVDSEGKTEFVIGQPMTLQIHEIVNIGRKGVRLPVKVSHAGTETNQAVDIKGISRNRGITLANIATVPSSSVLGTQPVKVCVGEICIPKSIEIKWDNQIKGLSKAGIDAEATRNLLVFIEGELINEWKEIYRKFPAQYQSLYDRTGAGGTLNLVEFGKTRLGQLDKVVKGNLAIAGFSEKIVTLAEDYQMLKLAMLDGDAAFDKIEQGFRPATVTSSDGTKVELFFSKMSPEQKQEAKGSAIQRQMELASWVKSDAGRSSKMTNCGRDSENLPCIGFINKKAAKSDAYRIWSLGNSHMTKILNAAKAKTSQK